MSVVHVIIAVPVIPGAEYTPEMTGAASVAVTDKVSEPIFPLGSFTKTCRILRPVSRAMLLQLQLIVVLPAKVQPPEPPRLLVHVTPVICALSEAVRDRTKEAPPVVKVGLDVGEVMVTSGTWVSGAE